MDQKDIILFPMGSRCVYVTLAGQELPEALSSLTLWSEECQPTLALVSWVHTKFPQCGGSVLRMAGVGRRDSPGRVDSGFPVIAGWTSLSNSVSSSLHEDISLESLSSLSTLEFCSIFHFCTLVHLSDSRAKTVLTLQHILGIRCNPAMW